ncbi:hypothetical protein Tco_0571621, partial [Tanacetum coccineum]
IIGRTNVGHGGRSGRGGRRGLSDHEAARGWGQISIQTNTSGTRYETNATITSDTGVQKSIWTNTSGTRYETNATMSSDTRVQKTIRTNTSGTCSETNTWVRKSIGTNTSGIHSETNATMSSDTLVQKTIRTNTSGTRVQKSIGTNTSSTRSETNATMSSDTRAQEPVGGDELNTNVSQRRRGSNIIEQVPQDPSKRTMISLDDGEFTDPKVIHKITSILKTMFNGSWTTWKEVENSGHDELWAHLKEGLSDVLVHDAWENSMKKRYPDIMSKARLESVKLAKAAGVQFEGIDCIILKPYNSEWIKSKHWEDMIDRVWRTKKWLNKAISGSKNRNTVKEGSVSKHYAGSITISQHKRKFNYLDSVCGELKEELKEEMKVDLKEEMKADLKEEMKADLKEEMKNDLKEEMR